MPKKLPAASKELSKLTKKVHQSQLTLSTLKTDFLVKELKEPSDNGLKSSYKIGHWNINGIRAVLKKETFIDYIKSCNFDILCFNETKIDKLKLQKGEIHDHQLWKSIYNQYWSFSTAKLGYSGVAILTKPKPISYEFGISQEKFDMEGRTVTLEYSDFYLVAVYVPNAGPECVRLKEKISIWDKAFQAHLNKLKEKKHVMVVGDLNVAHNPLDLHNPKANEGIAGYTSEERIAFSELLENGFKDTYRTLYPEKIQYTYFSTIQKTARPQNRGWRIDYCIVNKEAMERVEDSIIRDDIYGSDHVPIEIIWKTSTKKNVSLGTVPTEENKAEEKKNVLEPLDEERM